MARTNLKNVEKLIAEATRVAVTKLIAERGLDSDHIAEHVKASEDALGRLAALSSMIGDLISFENERLKALRAHLADIKTDEPALPEPEVPKRLNGGNNA